MKSITAGHNMEKALGTSRVLPGFSLAEVLAALTIGAMVLVAVLAIYNRAERSAAAVTRKLDGSRLPREILQRITEDLDSIISSGSDAKITIENKFEDLFAAAKLTITRTMHDSRDREQIFEEIVWQSSYDFESLTDGLVLYRSHSGITWEDKVLEKNKEDWERELFVPLCSGVTFFKISAVKGEEPVDRWSGPLPPGIMVTISFAEPFKRVDGTMDVLDEEKIARTIAIDRTKKIKFEIVEKEYSEDEEEKATDVDLPDAEKFPLGDLKKTEKVKL
jgi:prepilin-type N-terminal cleavage/methylation domain-containing protein